MNNIKKLEERLQQTNLTLKEKVSLYNQLSWSRFSMSLGMDKAVLYSLQGYEIAQRINDQYEMACALINQAFLDYYIKSDMVNALKKSYRAFDIFKDQHDQIGICKAYISISIYYFRINDYEKGFYYINKSIKICKNIEYDEGLAWAYYFVGDGYLILGDLEAARQYLHQSQELFAQIDNIGGKCSCISSIGKIIHTKEDYELALTYHQKSLTLSTKHKLDNHKGRALDDIGVTYESLNQYAKAINYLMQGLKIRESTLNKQGIATSQINLGRVLSKTKNYQEALKFLELAERYCQEIQDNKKRIHTHKLRIKIYKEINKPWKALEQYEIYMDVKAKIIGSENDTLLKNIQAGYEVEKANEKAQVEQLKNIELQEAYDKIEAQTKNIIDSIKYAKRIQESFLTPMHKIQMSFEDCFVLHKPRNIVSGDFYWSVRKENKVILTVADCTGHGVPGAFMVILASALLSEIVNNDNINCPGEILTVLDKKVRNALNQNHSRSSRDGMDIALCVFDKKNSELIFAGAKRPLYKVYQQKMEYIRGSKFTVGGFLNKKVMKRSYVPHKIRFMPNDMYYMASDGFSDQFGGKHDRKYMTKRFRELLLKVSDLPLQQQKEILEEELKKWKGNNHQTDDILVLGVRT